MTDPHKWLEDVLGEEAMKWVASKNTESIAAIGEPTATTAYKRILAILDSKDKIPNLYRVGGPDGLYYNFWQDDVHIQGIWRKTTLESYKSGTPSWKTVIDVDSLPPPQLDTAKTWVWHGSTLLEDGPDTICDRAIIALSPGGSDADTRREFDLTTDKWVEAAEGGYVMPTAAKTQLCWRSRDEILVGTDFGGDGKCLTDSGYPRVIKSWKRGTPIEDAKVVFEGEDPKPPFPSRFTLENGYKAYLRLCAGEQTDVSASQYSYHDRGFVHEFQLRSITFYTSKYWYRQLSARAIRSVSSDAEPTPFEEVKVPEDAKLGTFASAALVELRTDWQPPGCSVTFKAGSLISAPMESVMKGDWSKVKALFEPTPSRSLNERTETKDYVVLKVMEHVCSKLEFWKFVGGDWFQEVAAGGAAVNIGEDVSVENVSRQADEDNTLWITREGYLVPDSQEMANAENGCTVTQQFRTKPAVFNAQGLSVWQYFATSLDGTKVPYFVIGRTDMKLDGSNATLLDAYGGFEIPMLPCYSGTVGAAWLEIGGVKVIANIRGGGEYGPTWHQAALKANRHKAYEDVEAVAQDLIARRITCTSKMAVIGGSNGGLMVGNMLTRPIASTLFGAAVCQVSACMFISPISCFI
jgi:prolyl oligopeptidase